MLKGGLIQTVMDESKVVDPRKYSHPLRHTLRKCVAVEIPERADVSVAPLFHAVLNNGNPIANKGHRSSVCNIIAFVAADRQRREHLAATTINLVLWDLARINEDGVCHG